MIAALLLVLSFQRATPVALLSATVLKPAETSLIGIIAGFEERARTLTLATSDGAKVSFVIASDATIRMGPRTLGIHDLSTHSGRRAKVRFTVANGRRTAHWVAISSDPPRDK